MIYIVQSRLAIPLMPAITGELFFSYLSFSICYYRHVVITALEFTAYTVHF